MASVRSTSSGRRGRARRSPTAQRGRPWRSACRRASRPLLVSPTSPALPSARTSSSRCWRSTSAPLESVRSRARASSSSRWSGVSDGGHVLTLAAPGAAPPRPRQVRDRRRRRPQQRAGGARNPVGAASSARGTPRGAVPRPALGARPRAPLRHLLPHRRTEGSFIPAGASPTAGCSRWTVERAPPKTPALTHRPAHARGSATLPAKPTCRSRSSARCRSRSGSGSPSDSETATPSWSATPRTG